MEIYKHKIRFTKKLFLSLFVVLSMILTLTPQSVFASNKSAKRILGELSKDGKAWEFVIPEDAGDEVVLDFTSYMDSLLQNVSTYDHFWSPGATSTKPFIIKNESGKVFKYADADFLLDMEKDASKDYHYIDGPDAYGSRPNDIPKDSVVRVASQPLQSLFGVNSPSKLTVDNVVNAEAKIQQHGQVTANEKTATIPATVNTYADYALWFYNSFYDSDAESLDDLKMVYKLNLLGYARYNDPENLSDGNTAIKESLQAKGLTDQQIQTQIVEPRDALVEGKSFGHHLRMQRGANFAWAHYDTVIVESDPQIIQLAKDVLYQYGLRFSFDSSVDYDKIMYYEADTEEERDQQWKDWFNDKGELGWSTLCKTDFKVETLAQDQLTSAQQSMKKTIGQIRIEPTKTIEFNKPYLTMPGYAVVNAHRFMGALAGLSMNVTLKSVQAANFDSKALELQKRVVGAVLEDKAFTFEISSPQKDGISFEKTTCQNDENGYIDFGMIRFDQAGEYIVSVSEVQPEKVPAGWKYDQNDINFKFTVTENGFAYDVECESPDNICFVNRYGKPSVGPQKPTKEDEINSRDGMNKPQTSDDTQIMLLIGASVISLGLMTSLYRKKEHE